MLNRVVLIVTKDESEDIMGLAKTLLIDLKTTGYYIPVICKNMEIPLSVVPSFVITIGGDGTILKVIRDLREQVPIIGINMGGVGFLADLERDNAREYIENNILNKKFLIKEQMRVELHRPLLYSDVVTALNEISINTIKPGKLLDVSIIIDDVETQRFKADGIIISTPTGSTAYAMSAGGPIMDPLIRGFLVVPIAPFLLSSRPQIISEHHKFEIGLNGTEEAYILIDGQPDSRMCPGHKIEAKISKHPAQFIDTGKNFFVTVGEKLKR